jgi:hypothetical protein
LANQPTSTPVAVKVTKRTSVAAVATSVDGMFGLTTIASA